MNKSWRQGDELSKIFQSTLKFQRFDAKAGDTPGKYIKEAVFGGHSAILSLLPPLEGRIESAGVKEGGAG